MDDDEIREERIEYPDAKRHTKWTVIVLALDWLHNVTLATAETIGSFVIAAGQHGTQKDYDRKFDEITKEYDG